MSGKVNSVSVEYHIAEPTEVSISEKRELGEFMCELMRRVDENLP